MTTARAAIAPGRHRVRVAVATGSTARLVAELPPGPPPAAVLREVLGPGPVDEIVLVHPPGAALAPWHAATAGVARRVRTVLPAVAAAGGATAVLDVGRSGADAVRIEGGRIAAHAHCAIGGDRLDAAVLDLLGPPARLADARAVRERLSLLPVARCGPVTVSAAAAEEAQVPLLDELVAACAGVLQAAPGRVLLVGGVARAPLLAERIDAAGLVPSTDLVVAVSPDRAAVLGALADAPGITVAPRCRPMPAGALLPAPGPRPRLRRGKRPALAGFAALLAGTATALVAAGPPRPAAPGTLVQYGYRLDLPAGWEHTGGAPEHRRSLLTRIGAPDGTDAIAVERTVLGYEATAEPERARAELRASFDAAVAGGSDLHGYAETRIAGRAVTTYRQRGRDGVEVQWFVTLDGDSQLSVGCRHTPAGEAALQAACQTVLASIRRI